MNGRVWQAVVGQCPRCIVANVGKMYSLLLCCFKKNFNRIPVVLKSLYMYWRKWMVLWCLLCLPVPRTDRSVPMKKATIFQNPTSNSAHGWKWKHFPPTFFFSFSSWTKESNHGHSKHSLLGRIVDDSTGLWRNQGGYGRVLIKKRDALLTRSFFLFVLTIIAIPLPTDYPLRRK